MIISLSESDSGKVLENSKDFSNVFITGSSSSTTNFVSLVIVKFKLYGRDIFLYL
jgi:hypothetical protein